MPARLEALHPIKREAHAVSETTPWSQSWWCLPSREIAKLRAMSAPVDRYLSSQPAWATVTAMAGTALISTGLMAKVGDLCLPAAANLQQQATQRLPTLAYAMLNLAASGNTLQLPAVDWAVPCMAGACLGWLATMPFSAPTHQALVMAAGVAGTTLYTATGQTSRAADPKAGVQVSPQRSQVQTANHVAAQAVLAQVHLGHLQSSAQSLEKCLLGELDAATHRALALEQVHCHIIYGRYEAGLLALTGMDVQHVGDASVLALRAVCLYRTQQHAQAAVHLRQALIIEPDDFWVCYARGLITHSSVFFIDALKKNPAHRLAAILAEYYRPRKSKNAVDLRRWLQTLDDALAPLCKEGFALYWRGYCYKFAAQDVIPRGDAQQWMQKARQLCDEAMRQHPHYSLPLSLKVALLAEGGNNDEAKQVLDQALAHFPNDPNLQWALAFSQNRQGAGRQSLQAAQKAQAECPQSSIYFDLETCAYLQSDDYSAARASAQSYFRIGGSSSAYQRMCTAIATEAGSRGNLYEHERSIANQRVACL